MRREIRIAGFGGQGVVTMGTILAVAAGIYEDLEVAQTQSYGPEARGGACRADLVISDEPIDYTKPLALDIFIALSPAGIERYWSEVQEGKTVVLVDKTLIPDAPKHSPQVLAIEATRIAEEEFQDRVVANMVMLGLLSARTSWVSLKALEEALKGRIPERALEISKAALRRGFELGSKLKAEENKPCKKKNDNQE
ncbi:MAG: 2-oxoacid:acceptor oxidoreductase family protein [Deltaproteobacteria bacterium]|nr:2-oxoacid:acceptor oxidoreductase family protein [Deltaproteobacteria bacterium]